MSGDGGMDFKDYYATLGVANTATHDEIRRAYRKLARKYHPDVSKEPDAEARFKEAAEAHEALIDAERRAAYDEVVSRRAAGGSFEAPPGWDTGFEFSGRGRPWGDGASEGGHDPEVSEFFEALFGRGKGGGGRKRRGGASARQGEDHHAKVAIELIEAYRGARRTVTLRTPVIDEDGATTLRSRELEVEIPKGIREGQHLRLAGQGSPGEHGGPAGDLYLEVRFLPHPVFRVDGRDVSFDLPVAPWEAALGASVGATTPVGEVQLTVPAGSTSGRTLRLRGKGLPGAVPGDLYAVLAVVLPPASTEAARDAYMAFGAAFPTFDPRSEPQA